MALLFYQIVSRDASLQTFLTLPVMLITFSTALLCALSVHEFGHAYIAYKLGDRTAKISGRLSLNPIKHLDPVGSLMFLFVGFGWGKPVPVDIVALNNSFRQLAFVSIAGPASNFVFALLLGLSARFFSVPILPFGYALDPQFIYTNIANPFVWVGSFLSFSIIYNIVLGVFNLIPLAPLDGSKILIGVSPKKFLPKIFVLERYGPFVLMALVGLDLFFGISTIWRIVFPPVYLFSQLVIGYSLI
ncbi:MAG: site-2 protease family protein [Dehalococcoidia bacterium]